jgi:undecaprenyl pyrophosphate phosphatase UppP
VSFYQTERVLGEEFVVHIIIGALMMAGLLLLVDFTRKRDLSVVWWQWLLTVLAFAYATFVIEVVVSFLAEGSPKAAVVMGMMLGLAAVVWGVLLSRFVFNQRRDVLFEEEPGVNE